MAHFTQNKHLDYSGLIMLGSLAVNASLQTARTLFLDREQCETYYSYKEKKEVSLEVQFESSVLTCLFDNNNTCERVFLLVDTAIDFVHCIEYCCNTFPMHEGPRGWETNHCLIQIYIDNQQEYGLSISPI
ncbi:MAG: hypothetical protein LKI39_02995 [Bacteroides sp.]|jgi:hypothetical protein|nr:hypothetical protein [Bacteroides sp.]MCI1681504.1 hypothetical protein [Bacteroides sp.]